MPRASLIETGIETPRLILRGWQESDHDPFAQINQDPDVMRYLGPTLSREQSGGAIDKQSALIAKDEPAFWAVEHKSSAKLIGCIGVKEINFNAPFMRDEVPYYEIGWRLGKDVWGQGLASEGAQAALQFTFENWNIEQIHSFTVHANLASQKVMEKIGMRRIKGGDFDHPKLAKDDPLSGHVLYVIGREKFQATA